MGALSRGQGRQLLDGSLGTAAFVPTTNPIRTRLMTTNGNETTNGTEVTPGAGYTGGTSAPSVTFNTTDANGTAASNTPVTVTNMPAATIRGVELWDSAGVPMRKFWGALTSDKTTVAGDTFSIAAGSLTVTLT